MNLFNCQIIKNSLNVVQKQLGRKINESLKGTFVVITIKSINLVSVSRFISGIKASRTCCPVSCILDPRVIVTASSSKYFLLFLPTMFYFNQNDSLYWPPVGQMSNKTQLGMWRASLTLPTKASISPLRFQVGQVGQVILAVQVVKNLICGALLEVDIVTMALTSGGSI